MLVTINVQNQHTILANTFSLKIISNFLRMLEVVFDVLQACERGWLS